MTLDDQSICDIQDELLRTDWTPIITNTIDDAYARFIDDFKMFLFKVSQVGV